MDGLVLALAIILNPRSKKAAECGEQNSRAGASDSDGSGVDSGVDHGDGTAQVAAVMVMPPSDNKERSAEEDHLTPAPITV